MTKKNSRKEGVELILDSRKASLEGVCTLDCEEHSENESTDGKIILKSNIINLLTGLLSMNCNRLLYLLYDYITAPGSNDMQCI